MKRSFCLAALAATAALATACGSEDENGGEPAATQEAEAATLELRATADGDRKAIEAPETVPAGLVSIRLVNEDEVEREAQLIRVTGDQSAEDVLEVVGREGGPLPEWIQDGGGVAPVEAGQTGTVEQVLEPGRYVVFDTGVEDEASEDAPDNAEKGATAELTVEGEAAEAELPEAEGGTITAVDFDFETEGLRAGRNVVRFENTGEQLHHALLFPINEGVEFEDVQKAFTSEEEPEGPPPVDFENVAGTAVIDGGIAQNVELDLQQGRYAAVCFIQNREGGPPHAVMGMVSEVTVE